MSWETVCANMACKKRKEAACHERHPCGHWCYGAAGEVFHPPWWVCARAVSLPGGAPF
jgi:hypothetical protein